MKRKGLVIAGPTGVGKTSISIRIAKELKADIISADSAQVYRGLDIGTAKINEIEKEGVYHHMIDILEPIKKYSVGKFQKEVDKILAIKEEKNENIMLVGGTGLYIESIVNGLASLPKADENIRKEFLKYDVDELYEKLKQVDPESAKTIHLNNRVRIERALEVFEISGEKFSELSKHNVKNNNYDFLCVALERDRDNLYERINQRVDLMLEQGLLEETENLYKLYGEKFERLNIIGYSRILSYLKGEFSLAVALDKVKQDSRKYAKRQLTWFKNKSEYIWYDLDVMEEEEVIFEITNILKKK